MNFTYVSLLQVQRDLYRLPRGFERFREYLQTMIDAKAGDLKLPLVAMNPMGKDHLPVFLDHLHAMGADQVASEATSEAMQQLHLPGAAGTYKVCLVVSDDLLGGWTNRYTSELSYRFQQKSFYKRGWIPGVLWSSEVYTVERVREEVLLCLFRAWYVQQHGEAVTVGEMLAQEREVMRMAGTTRPMLDTEDIDYTREVITPYLSRSDWPVVIGVLYGDEASRQLGYRPLGLSPRAGLALALADAQAGSSKEL